MSAYNYRFPFLLLMLFVCASYANTFHVPWQFDDFSNILTNQAVQVEEISVDSLLRATKPTFANGNISRPLAYISLALNWYIGGNNVVGYHVVNILIHFLTSYIIFLLILNLYCSPVLRGNDAESAYKIALLGAICWAVHPIQVQAVTYIVQRMASMAALFYLSALLCYILLRNAQVRSRKIVYGIVAGCCFLAALGTKENTVTLPLAVLLVEMIFFREYKMKRPAMAFIVVSIMMIIGVSLVLVLSNTISNLGFFSAYEDKSFTLASRFLTEFRVLVYYLSLLIYPLPSRLSLIYDVPYSTSLFHPISTLLSLMCIIGLVASAVTWHKRYPVLAFAILFFFLNHLIESTILPLEIVFEHRNYLPSAFIFWPVAGVVIWGVRASFHRNYTAGALVTSAALFCLLSLALWTFQRNMVWKTGETLWFNVLKKFPETARPYQSLANSFTEHGQPDQALKYYLISLDKRDETPIRGKWLSLNNIGLLYSDAGDYDRARSYFEQALDVWPGNAASYTSLILNYIKQGNYGGAEELADRVLASSEMDEKSFLYYKVFYYKGFLRMKAADPKKAVGYLEHAHHPQPKDIVTGGVYVLALAQSGQHDQALVQLAQLLRDHPDKLPLRLMQIEIALHQKNMPEATRLVRNIVMEYPLKDIKMALKKTFASYPYDPILFSFVELALSDSVKKVAGQTP